MATKKQCKDCKYLSRIKYEDKDRFINGKYLFNKSIIQIQDKICNKNYKHINLHCDSTILEDYINNIKEVCNNLNMKFKCFESSVCDKLVIGLGNSSVTETSMTLHHIYGIPYIPGQALKGCVRSYFLYKYFDIEKGTFHEIDIVNIKNNGKKLYEDIFGNDMYGDNNKKGNVVFFDSFPINNTVITKQDVMTPHYTKYYQKFDNPTDSFSTIPIFFNTISDVNFNIIFGINNKYDENIKRFIINLVKDTLTEHGVGAKTSVGYGYFDVK